MRLENTAGYTPRDIERLSVEVREALGSRESASHFRVSEKALEFNLFARDEQELETRKSLLEKRISKITDLKAIDRAPIVEDKVQGLREGVNLFNEERFWESQEVLEQLWNTAKGEDRDTLQGLILTGAAFVHHQKGEDDICLSILKRAKAKLGSRSSFSGINLANIQRRIEENLASKRVQLFKIGQ